MGTQARMPEDALFAKLAALEDALLKAATLANSIKTAHALELALDAENTQANPNIERR